MRSRRDILGGLGGLTLAALFAVRGNAAPLAKVKELGVLRVAVYKENRPWSWRRDGKLAGIDVDLAASFAQKLGVRLDAAELTADESVDDDLRNAVWKGGLLGFQACDLMMHVPFDRTFAARNDQVAIIAPYFRESFSLACGNEASDCELPPPQFKGKRLAAELDSIPDFYLIGSFGGVLKQDVAHFPTGADAVAAVADGKADVVVASKAQIEHVLAERKSPSIHRRKGPLPAMLSPGWDIGMAVKENSRTLGDAIEQILADMTASGETKAIFDRYGVTYTPALAA